MKLTFNGAAKTVTGSCHHVETGSTQFLVDCGMFQGGIQETKLNRDDFSFDPAKLDFVILTHCHIDHSGRLPLLVKKGFTGKIFMTPPTKDLVEILLHDSAKIQLAELQKTEDEEIDPEDLLYTDEDVFNTIQYFYPLEYEETHTEGAVTFTYHNAGHLLGSAYVKILMEDKTYVFSGDLGHKHSLLQNPPVPIGSADYLVLESTYGNRRHEHIDTRLKNLYNEMMNTYSNGGTIIIPAFSVGRTQDMLYALKQYADKNGKLEEFSSIPIYLDSPLAVNATGIYLSHIDYLKEGFDKKYIEYDNVHIVKNMQSSIGLNFNRSPKIIISAAGMCDAGRIVNHLESYLPDELTKILFVGYQSEESLGRKIQNKENPVQIGKNAVANNAQIVRVDGFSGHGDLDDLKEWAATLDKEPIQTILVHGELDALASLKKELEQENHTVHVAELFETIELN
jgi:metallo-beta-lactamase family protein